ncbi:MAG: type IV pilus assembly protein PilC [Oceanicoccus sp.]|jgi:type IV pilus assembly protein PilC
MANTNNEPVTLDIGLSREDMDRIEELRRVDIDKAHDNRSILVKINESLAKMGGVKLQEKVTFFQLLSVMINAGVPIIRSLYVLSDQTKNPYLKIVIRDMAKKMEEGTTFAKTMAAYPKAFTDAERGMIASGEASGNLNEILKDIAKQAEKSAKIVAKVKGAMIYPIAIVTIMMIALFIMLTMVVPKLEGLFNQGGQELPKTTEVLIGLSDWAQNSWGLVLAGAVLLVLGLKFAKRYPQVQYGIDYALLYMPIFGTLVRKLMISRFARMLASLMDAGIPIVKALEINAAAVGNHVYKRRIEFASQDVAQGIPLGENLTNNEFLFPPMVASMITIGEQTSNLTEVSTKIADYYEDEVDTAVSSLSKLMEPVILVVMGAGVGFIVAAIMQPIMALSDLSGAL